MPSWVSIFHLTLVHRSVKCTNMKWKTKHLFIGVVILGLQLYHPPFCIFFSIFFYLALLDCRPGLPGSMAQGCLSLAGIEGLMSEPSRNRGVNADKKSAETRLHVHIAYYIDFISTLQLL